MRKQRNIILLAAVLALATSASELRGEEQQVNPIQTQISGTVIGGYVDTSYSFDETSHHGFRGFIHRLRHWFGGW